ncbi:hypothetical protein NB231_07492 [Nitrococcus mobilis Nb-231]|uniref:tRNA(Met) cytidine acetyltransferase TmcA n=1 Tax=Nitrococcus mobilis Nb-231 TaxID=314278 RepID=A4BT93_9GAMM|nr:hypothetical protein NB231_07492 [Nitrococcus mobilis Nb-231]
MQALREFATALIGVGRAAHHRQIVVIAGKHDWCLEQADLLLEQSQLATIAWLGDRPPTAAITPLNIGRTQLVLGKEIDALVVDAWDGFDPDAFGATIGAVHGGGLVLLLAPPLAKWPDYADPATDRIATYPYTRRQLTGRYLKRLVRVIRSSTHALVLEPNQPLPRVAAPTLAQSGTVVASSRTLPTPDQQRAIAAIERCARGHRHRPVVLTSDRGRGKSAALGIAAARLLRAGYTQIIVTAPSLASAATVFTHARCLMPDAHAARGYLSDGRGRLEFMAPDALLRRPQAAELLLVDEAAAISTAILSALLGRYARIVFASTVHGYEGTGRGFALRFRQVLDRHTPDWREYWLETPIRWAADDPAERFAFQALLLNALPAPQAALVDATAGRCQLERLDRDVLVDDEPTLSELFGLLVLAHYRTTPGDLRQLLDAPGLSVWVLRDQRHIAAAALVIDEGGFPPALARAIWLGLRRPQGHLVAQSLAAHAGLAQAPTLHGRRVLRIAVHPACRRRGLGTRLLGGIFGDARGHGIDYLAAAFGVTNELLGFWTRFGMQIVRLGNHREASSGNCSAIVLRALSQTGEQFIKAAAARFADRLPALLNEPLRDLDPALALTLLQQFERPGAPAPEEWDDLLAFGFGRRQYMDTLPALQRLTHYALTDPRLTAALSRSEQLTLLARTLQRREWSELAGYLAVPGRRQVVAALRTSVRRLALISTEPQVRHRARELLQAR